jgi:hypothetical protein
MVVLNGFEESDEVILNGRPRGGNVTLSSAKTYADWVYTSATTYANTQDDAHTTSANAYTVSGAYVALTSALVADVTTLASAKTYADWVYTSATTYANTQDDAHTTSANAYSVSGSYVALTSALVADATTLASAKTYADWVYTSATTYSDLNLDLGLNRFISGEHMSKSHNDSRLAIYGGVQGSGNAVLVINSCSGSSVQGGFRFLTTKADGITRQDVMSITGNTNSPVVDLKLGHLGFPSAPISSGLPNVLDDYEIGTWSPTLTFNGYSSGLTYTISAGYYVKVGRVVHVNGRVIVNKLGSSSGNVIIWGLPFTIANSQNTYGGVAMRRTTINISGFITQAYGELNTTAMPLEALAFNGTVKSVYKSNLATGTDIMITFSYTAA